MYRIQSKKLCKHFRMRFFLGIIEGCPDLFSTRRTQQHNSWGRIFAGNSIESVGLPSYRCWQYLDSLQFWVGMFATKSWTQLQVQWQCFFDGLHACVRIPFPSNCEFHFVNLVRFPGGKKGQSKCKKRRSTPATRKFPKVSKRYKSILLMNIYIYIISCI